MKEHVAIAPSPGARPFSEFRDEGLLWLVNTAVFHPRGYALSFEVDDDGTVTGWQLLGDGTEAWQFSGDEVSQALTAQRFASVRALMP